MNINDLRKRSKTSLDNLRNAVQSLNKNDNTEPDKRFWKLKIDPKTKSGKAVIRFIPSPDEDDNLFIKYYDHAFQGPTGKWYIEKSLSSIGRGDEDIVSIENKKLWDSNIQANRELVSKYRKRRQNFVSNILVVRDYDNPENDGKVFLFRYGKKIFDKISALLNPEFDDESPVNAFDPWEGATLKLIMVTEDGYPNYNKSTFDSPAPISKDDDKIVEICNQAYSLKEFVDPANFKTPEELRKRYAAVMSSDSLQKQEDEVKMSTEGKASYVDKGDDDDESPPFQSDDSNIDDELKDIFAQM